PMEPNRPVINKIENAPVHAGAGTPAHWRSPAFLPAAILVLAGLAVAQESVVALAYALIEGGVVLGLLAAAALAGVWWTHLLGLGREEWRERLMVGAGLGIGTLSLAVLALGSAGCLAQTAYPLVGVIVVAALLRAGLDVRRAFTAAGTNSEREDQAATPPSKAPPSARDPNVAKRVRREALALAGYHYLWLLAIPFLAFTVLAATLPPGILWREEAHGYDVLEYHLAVPKDFFEAGRIFFMPYNVYSNFPLNSGMLSLLFMTLRGDAIEAAFAAQLTNVGLAVLFVAAAWWAGRFYSRKAGVIAGVLAATTPWISYLAGIAYVEPGMLAMGMLALGAILRSAQPGPNASRWVLAAGLLAGLACGYKYTAVPLVAIPLAVVPLLVERDWATCLKHVGLFAAGALLTFSPWMIRNLVNTGNPVFPLAWSVFGAREGVWDEELQARWQRGHGWAGSGIGPDQPLLRAVLERTVLDVRLGLMLVILAIAGAIRKRDRWTLAFLVVLGLQAVIWFTATHLFARFAVVLILPLLLLASRLADGLKSRVTNSVIVVAVVLGAMWNLYHFARLYYIHTHVRTESGEIQAIEAHGHTDWFTSGQYPGYGYLEIVNELEGSRVMFVGEARTFYVKPARDYAVVFSRHPLAEAVERIVVQPDDSPAATSAASESPPRRAPDYRAVVRWLSQRGVTHVLVNWFELERLHRTYGLDRQLTRGLFEELEAAGLQRVGGGDFMTDEGIPYATLYEVPDE
ncbi:MAG TPA: glycosyltransferase family 39 protein, partial [Phycisphaerae bacterium]|nr:glycosyltransferase family 39 protein [Phycisphaerae bacterium]